MRGKKDQLPRGRKQESCDCNRHLLQTEKNRRCRTAPAEESREEKHGGQRPGIAVPGRGSLGVRRSPIGSSHFRPNVHKKQDSKQGRDSGSGCLVAGCSWHRVVLLWRLSERHPQENNGQDGTEYSDYVKGEADARSAHGQHGEGRGRNRTGTPGQVHDTQGGGAASPVRFAHP